MLSTAKFNDGGRLVVIGNNRKEVIDELNLKLTLIKNYHHNLHKSLLIYQKYINEEF